MTISHQLSNHHERFPKCNGRTFKMWNWMDEQLRCHQKTQHSMRLQIGVTTIVLVRKPNGKLRVCLDPRTIIKALRFNVHNARTFQDVTTFNQEEWARSLRLMQIVGFETLPMDESSQLLTTFNTPWGCYCFTKMPFVLNQGSILFPILHGLSFSRHKFHDQHNQLTMWWSMGKQMSNMIDIWFRSWTNVAWNWVEIKSREMLLWTKRSKILWKHSQCRWCESLTPRRLTS